MCNECSQNIENLFLCILFFFIKKKNCIREIEQRGREGGGVELLDLTCVTTSSLKLINTVLSNLPTLI